MAARLLRRAGWAATWAVGAALGVALGAWLSVVGAAGAPGTGELDVASELVMTPVLAGVVVFVAYLVGAALVGALRSRRDRANADKGPAADE